MAVSETQVHIPRAGHADIPCTIWSATDSPSGVVLLGHGLGVDRFDATVRRPAELLARVHRAAVVVPEIPLHGVRAEAPYDTPDIVNLWQSFWVSGGIETICEELQLVARYCEERFDSRPLSYFGASLGTQYGIPFLAKTRNIRSAVLGLFGSLPSPKTPVMNRYAPAVRCPVYFIQKLDDEIHPAESTAHLFSTLGAPEKILDSTSGKHAEVSMDTIRNACAFLVERGQFHDV